jgi:hypothetical protein
MSPHSYFIYPGSKCEKLQPPEGGLLLTCSVALQVKIRPLKKEDVLTIISLTNWI